MHVHCILPYSLKAKLPFVKYGHLGIFLNNKSESVVTNRVYKVITMGYIPDKHRHKKVRYYDDCS